LDTRRPTPDTLLRCRHSGSGILKLGRSGWPAGHCLPLPPVDRGADLMLAGGCRCALEGPQRTLSSVPVRRRRGWASRRRHRWSRTSEQRMERNPRRWASVGARGAQAELGRVADLIGPLRRGAVQRGVNENLATLKRILETPSRGRARCGSPMPKTALTLRPPASSPPC
jgi:hypothetical protein